MQFNTDCLVVLRVLYCFICIVITVRALMANYK